MIGDRREMDSVVAELLSTPIGERQLEVLRKCIDEGNRELLDAVLSALNKWISQLEKWEMHPGIFLRKRNEYRLAASGSNEPLYRYCMVKIPGFDRSFCYMADDFTLITGDYVLVPFGQEDRLQLAQITRIMDCTAENAPFPLDKTKTIIGRTEAPTETQ